jgi:hypothetical protein
MLIRVLGGAGLGPQKPLFLTPPQKALFLTDFRVLTVTCDERQNISGKQP